MSKKFIRSFAIAMAFSAGVSAVAYASPTQVAEASEVSQVQAIANYSTSAEVTKYFNELNAVRKASGAQVLVLDPYLTKAAQSHAEYVVKNGATHTQDKNKPGFTGVTSSDRVVSAGGNLSNYSTVTEALATAPQGGVAEAFLNLLESTSHREILLRRTSNAVGVGISGNTLVFVTGRDYSGGSVMADKGVPYPYNGQTNADTAFNLTGNVVDSPLIPYGVSKAGYVVSYAPTSSTYNTAKNIELYDSKNARVSTLNSPNQADGGSSFFYVIPKSELNSGEKYTAKATWIDDDGNTQTDTWSFTTAGKSTTVTPPPTTDTKPPTTVTPPTTNTVDVSKFADYNANQYWASDFQWAVNGGLIQGYSNVKNPTTGKYENLLKPYTNLTENQMLSVLFRYFKPTELATTSPKTTWYGDVNYQLATKYKLPVLGTNTTTKQAYAGKDITRGNFARILASMHYGKTISQTEAIKFLRDNGLTTTKTDEEFKPSDSLTRAHSVAFFHRYEQSFNN